MRALTKTEQESASDEPAFALADVLDLIQKAIGEDVDADLPLMDAGIDSLDAVKFVDNVNAGLKGFAEISSTAIFEASNISIATIFAGTKENRLELLAKSAQQAPQFWYFASCNIGT